MHKAIIQILERLSEKEATVKRWKEQTHLAWILLGVASVFLIFLFVMIRFSFLSTRIKNILISSQSTVTHERTLPKHEEP